MVAGVNVAPVSIVAAIFDGLRITFASVTSARDTLATICIIRFGRIVAVTLDDATIATVDMNREARSAARWIVAFAIRTGVSILRFRRMVAVAVHRACRVALTLRVGRSETLGVQFMRCTLDRCAFLTPASPPTQISGSP
ncbi:MAG: hypothetical protein BWZ07_03134 [Alphaproteobacteria bacterium ADurb.BinA280]|nr:MAG: hypothetical protein BWZ07_03134 [Alphaproteobacteria bacterium ADurb.BinA280]